MLYIWAWLNLVIFSVAQPRTLKSAISTANTYGGKVQNVHMKTEEGLQLLQHWVDQAIGVFMAAVANKRLKTKPKHVIDEFGACCKRAQTIPSHAKCVSRLLKDQITGKKFLKKKPALMRFHKYNSRKVMHISERRGDSKTWIGGFHVGKFINSDYKRRFKRNLVVNTYNSYKLKSPNDGRMTPLGSVAQMLMKAILATKNKTVTKPWQETVQKIRDSSLKRAAMRKRLEEDSMENIEQFAFRGMKTRGMIGEDLEEIMQDPQRLKDFLKKKRNEKSKEPSTKLIKLIREGFKLGYTMIGNISALIFNGCQFLNFSLPLYFLPLIASPRFLSVVPENEDTKANEFDLLSPSLFSLHNQGKGIENLTSIPSLVKGFSSKDQQAWMDLIMEAAGVVEAMENIEETLDEKKIKTEEFQRRYKRESIGKDGIPLYFSKKNVTEMFGEFEERKITLFEKLCTNFTKEQIKEMNKTGYALLNAKQLHMLYGSASPYNNSKALQRFIQLNNSAVHQYIEDDFSRTAEMKSFKIRLKQVVLSPVSFSTISASVNNPNILSPIIFSPAILAPTVLGPVILSPTLFVPVILSPRVLSPLIITPMAFVPYILSPMVLHPSILSPGVFAPLILNPAALSA